MIEYLLDTNIVSSFIKRPMGPVAEYLRRIGSERVALNPIIAGELYFGLCKRPDARLMRRISEVLEPLTILPIESPTEHRYGEVRASLERRGTPIGANDLWIAAHALALDLTLVTANTDEFARVEGLRVENWLR